MQNYREIEVLGRTTFLAYANNIVILEESKIKLEGTKSVRKLIMTSKNMGFKIKENKNKNILMSKRLEPISKLEHSSVLF